MLIKTLNKKIQIIKVIDLFGKGEGEVSDHDKHVIYKEVSMVAHEDLLMAGVYISYHLMGMNFKFRMMKSFGDSDDGCTIKALNAIKFCN
jgi:hypothetical protein